MPTPVTIMMDDNDDAEASAPASPRSGRSGGSEATIKDLLEAVDSLRIEIGAAAIAINAAQSKLADLLATITDLNSSRRPYIPTPAYPTISTTPIHGSSVGAPIVAGSGYVAPTAKEIDKLMRAKIPVEDIMRRLAAKTTTASTIND